MTLIYNRHKQKENRKYLRNNSTLAETLLWQELKNNKLGDKFRRQHGIGYYIADFYCHELKLAIEIDGNIHLKQINEDIERQKIIEEDGIRFFRITSYEVENNINLVINQIKIFINNLKLPNPVPSPARNEVGEG